MCRNIKTLFNFDPPATDDEIQASALQFVRKLSGSTKPSAANQDVFDRAVVKVADVARELVDLDAADRLEQLGGAVMHSRDEASQRCHACNAELPAAEPA